MEDSADPDKLPSLIITTIIHHKITLSSFV